MSIRRSYERALDKKNEENKNDQKALRSLSKQKLKKAMSKKFQTCFIGAIDSIEEHMGALWGKDSDKELTKFQTAVLNRLKILRTEILDKGNAQLRAMHKELEEYDVSWTGRHIDIEIGE
jgi:hypothetical protein